MSDRDGVTERIGRPVLRVVTGEPSDEELAALLAVVLTRTAPAADQRRSVPGWADHAARLRSSSPVRPAWRSGLPR